MADRKTALLMKLAEDLGRLMAIKEADYALEAIGKRGLKFLMPIGIPAGIGALIADDDRRLEGAGLGAIGGIVGKSLFGWPTSKMMADPAIRKYITEAGGVESKARKLIRTANPTLSSTFERAVDTGEWMGRLAGGAAGGATAKYLMGPKKTSPEFGQMPTANYDLGGHYSGLLPEDAYEYGVW